MEDLRAQLHEAIAALQAHMASWPYAFAMAGGCHGGADHPTLQAVRDETERLCARCRDLEARIAEFS